MKTGRDLKDAGKVPRQVAEDINAAGSGELVRPALAIRAPSSDPLE